MPTAEDCERNKKIVILAAYHCYLRCGIEKTTQRDIAREANLTPRSIQRYFKDRDELLLAVTGYLLGKYNQYVQDYVSQNAARNKTALEEVVLFLECQKKIYLEYGGVFLLMNELDIYFKRYKERYLSSMRVLKKLDVMRPYLQDILRRGVKEHSIHVSTSLEDLSELIIATYTGLFHHFNFKYLAEDEKKREKDIQMLDLYICSLRRFLQYPA